ncbi:MAG: sulfatase [Acidobacteria bacterium]|nr:sulfatase [Acidobacteriota bacterium]
MPLERRAFLGSLAAGLAQAQPRPLNLLVIVADDLGWADVGCYGADLHETPHLDRLAAQGVRFTDAHSASPVCSPTRASIMTGKHPARLRITIWHEGALAGPGKRALIPAESHPNLPLSEITIAEVLKQRGYLTAAIGKWHLGDAGHSPETQGFDINIGGTHWGAPATFFYPYKGDQRFGGEFRYVPRMDGGREGEYLTDRLTEEALKVIDAAGGKPFFLYLAHHAPHTPIEGKKELVDHYRRKLKPGLLHQNAQYAAMVHSLDESVGRVMEHLERRGIADRTAVLFISDNGGYIGRFEGHVVTNNTPLRSGKGSLYEGGIRVPLIARAPGMAKGQVCDVPVVSTDLFRTIAELAGVQGPAHDGVSLVPLLKDPRARLPRSELFFHYPHYYETTTPVSAIRSGDWKLLRYYEDHRVELFRLDQDRSESKDLSASEPGMRQRLEGRLEEWLREVDAALPRRSAV